MSDNRYPSKCWGCDNTYPQGNWCEKCSEKSFSWRWERLRSRTKNNGGLIKKQK